MKAKILAGVLLAVALPAVASAAEKHRVFQLVLNTKSFDASETFTGPSRGQQIIPNLQTETMEISPVSAVQLDGDVALVLAKSGLDKEARLPAGTALYSTGTGEAIYCPKARDTSGPRTPCLIDSDGDGRFDHAARTLVVLNKPTHVVMDDKTLTGNVLDPQVTLPMPIPYHKLDSMNVPPVAAKLVWHSDHQFGNPGPVHFDVGICTFGEGQLGPFTSGSFCSQTKSLTFNGTPVEVDLFGLEVTVVGMNNRGAPIYRLQGQIDNVTTDFTMRDAALSYSFAPPATRDQ